MSEELFTWMVGRRRLSSSMPSYTMRDDSRVDTLSAMDDVIRLQAEAEGMTECEAWAAFDRIVEGA